MQLGHVGLYVCDFDRMLTFYRDVFGMAVTDIKREGRRPIVFLSTDPGSHHQLVLVGGRSKDVTSQGLLNQVSFRLSNLGELKRVYDRLVAHGCKEMEPITHGTAWSVYFRDPEDNRIEGYVDTEWYITQPFRAPIDLTRSEAQLREDVEAICRQQPGFMPMREWRDKIAQLIVSGSL